MKKKFAVYFEIFGKKMKTEVIAKDEHDARMTVLNKVKFHQVQFSGFAKDEEDIYSHLKDIFNI